MTPGKRLEVADHPSGSAGEFAENSPKFVCNARAV